MKRIQPILGLTMLALASALTLTACGGGSSSGNDSGIKAADTTTAVVYAGPIMGKGSVVVNGMRFSSVGAKMVDGDDDAQPVGLDQLQLGMTVRVSGEVDETSQQGTANRLELLHGTRGLLTAVDVAAGTLTLLGQTVHTNTATGYLGIAGLSQLTVGQAIEVYGALQADGSMLATLIERKTTLATSRLIGLVDELNTTANSFQVGSLTINYNPNTVTGVLGYGKQVKIMATSAPVGNVLIASSVLVSDAGSVYGTSFAAGARLKLKGVADAAPVNGMFKLSGTPVNVSQAVIKGGAGAVVAGRFIEVKGNWDGSTLQATTVELEDYRESQIGGRNELYGAVSSINGGTVVVDGVTVDLRGAVFQHGSLVQVVVGSYVEIKGNLVGNILHATKVELKTTNAASGVSYEQYGAISGFVSAASFKLNGLQVDASQARFEHSSAANLANGIYVEIKGAQNGSGVFVASKVEIKTGHND
ncbi:MAG: DUF5666 domain-containing protein [Burkholderiaceae bacterium]